MEKSKLSLAGEEQNKKKARKISGIIHLLLLLIMWFYFFPAAPEKDPDIPPKIVVDFSFKPSSLSKYAHADTGAKKPKTKNVERKKVVTPKEVKKVEVKKPVIKQPDIKKPVVKPKFDPVTTPNTQDDSPVEMVEDDEPVDDPEMELDEVPEPEEMEEVVVVPVKEIPVDDVKVEDTSSESGTPSDTDGTADEDPSMTEGEDGGTGKGKDGKGPGDGKGDDSTSGKGDAGDGTGEFDGSGDGVFGRQVIYRNLSGIFKIAQQSGIITAKICINRAGIVSYAEIVDMETDITDRTILKKALTAFQGYKYAPDFTASKEQCGKLTLKLDIDALRGR